MPVQTSDFFKKHLITTPAVKASEKQVVRTTTKGVKKGFAAVLNQVQATCKGVSGVGKNCLNKVNPVNHLTALYQVAQAGMLPRIDTSDIETSSPADTETLSSGQNSVEQAENMLSAFAGAAGTDGTADPSQSAGQLGLVSARYESGSQGVNAIGYDRKGGTSYGTYQISSKSGTMSRFIDYLKEVAPQWASRLEKSGSANTGSTRGSMPREWKKIAAEDPELFEKLQYDFIKKSHYEEALAQISEENGFNVAERSQALKETLWSTSVQHGASGAADIFNKALERLVNKGQEITDKKLIDEIYSNRARYFRSSTRRVRYAVQTRFSQEKTMVLAMLKDEQSTQKV